MTVFAVPDDCPDKLTRVSDDPRCDWTFLDVAWYVAIWLLAAMTVVWLIIVAATRMRRRVR